MSKQYSYTHYPNNTGKDKEKKLLVNMEGEMKHQLRTYIFLADELSLITKIHGEIIYHNHLSLQLPCYLISLVRWNSCTRAHTYI